MFALCMLLLLLMPPLCMLYPKLLLLVLVFVLVFVLVVRVVVATAVATAIAIVAKGCERNGTKHGGRGQLRGCYGIGSWCGLPSRWCLRLPSGRRSFLVGGAAFVSRSAVAGLVPRAICVRGGFDAAAIDGAAIDGAAALNTIRATNTCPRHEPLRSATNE